MEPELLVLGTMLVGITLYALLGGADFGGGVWEFNTALRAPDDERELIYRAIGPVWEANHVWLIFVLVGLFSAFPPAFAALSRALWIPLLLALTGIVFRGVGFAFRSYAAGAVAQQAVWGAVFAVASTAAPFFLGAAAGAVARGDLAVDADGGFAGDVLTDWVSPTSLWAAFLTVGVCAYLAALYLTRETAIAGEARLVAVWRRRGLLTGFWVGLLAGAGLVIVANDAPWLWNRFGLGSGAMVGLSAVAGAGSLAALWWRRYTVAVGAGALAAAAVIWGWAVAQYPLLVPPELSIEAAKADDTVLWVMVGAIAVGAVLLAPALLYLFLLFKGKRPE